MPPKPKAFQNWPRAFALSDEPADPFGRPVVVDRWHDGDTFFHWTWHRDGVVTYDACRIADLYAPELHEPGGPEARDAAAALYPPGSRLKAQQLYPSFDRWVDVVWDEAARNVNARFLDEGIGTRDKSAPNRAWAESTHPDSGLPFRSAALMVKAMHRTRPDGYGDPHVLPFYRIASSARRRAQYMLADAADHARLISNSRARRGDDWVGADLETVIGFFEQEAAEFVRVLRIAATGAPIPVDLDRPDKELADVMNRGSQALEWLHRHFEARGDEEKGEGAR